MNWQTAAVLCAAVATLLLGLAVREARIVRRLRRHGVRSRGLVVRSTRDDYSDRFNEVPVIAFRDQHGRLVEFSPEMRGTGMNIPVGREVPVVHEDQRPETARVQAWRHMTGVTVALLCSSAAFLGATVLIVLKR